MEGAQTAGGRCQSMSKVTSPQVRYWTLTEPINSVVSHPAAVFTDVVFCYLRVNVVRHTSTSKPVNATSSFVFFVFAVFFYSRAHRNKCLTLYSSRCWLTLSTSQPKAHLYTATQKVSPNSVRHYLHA